MNKRELTKWRETYTEWDTLCTGEGFRLAVHFDEKDYVKRMGARWNPDPSGGKGGYWWMPLTKLDNPCPYDDVEFDMYVRVGETVLTFLNKYEMVFGPYGKQMSEKCEGAVQALNLEGATYSLESIDDRREVYFYDKLGICAFRQSSAPTTGLSHNQFNWYTAEDGRIQWDSLVAEGFYRNSQEND